MDGGYMTQIRDRILSAVDGTTSDFADITDSATVRQSLNQLVQAGIIRRVLRGIFEKPKYSSVLNEFVEVNPDAVAKTLARTYHWTIALYGTAALYLLGLSGEEPTVWFCISNRPYRTYEWNSTRLAGQIKNSFRNALTIIKFLILMKRRL